jgi:Tol biopolymer transport system component
MTRIGQVLAAGCAALALLSAQAAPGQPGAPLLGARLIGYDTATGDRISLVDLESGVQRDLRFGGRMHKLWGFSPDGCRILLTLGEGDAPPRLYTARLDGTGLIDLATFEPGYGAWDAAWSPDSTDDRIAFTLFTTQDDGDGVPEHRIALVSSRGGEAPVPYSVAGDEHTPRWSPDGRWLTYVSFERREDNEAVREAELWRVSADGTQKFQVTNFPQGSVHSPRWSPNGELIGFIYSPSPNSDQFWMVGAQENAFPTQLSYEPVLTIDYTWLPDSTAMVAAARDMQGIPDNRLWQIPLVGNADVDARLLTVPADLIYPYVPRYSPDGAYLAARTAYAVGVVEAASGALTVLPDSLGNTAPHFPPAAFQGESACAS